MAKNDEYIHSSLKLIVVIVFELFAQAKNDECIHSGENKKKELLYSSIDRLNLFYLVPWKSPRASPFFWYLFWRIRSRPRSRWPYFQRSMDLKLCIYLSISFWRPIDHVDFSDFPLTAEMATEVVGRTLRSFTVFFWEMVTVMKTKRVTRINFQVIHFFFYKCLLTLCQSCLPKAVY